MTATTDVPAVATSGPGLVGALARACAAEWTALRTVRTTWWCLLAAAVTIVGIGALLGLDASSDPARDQPWPPAHVAGELALMPGQFALLVLACLAVTSDYATGAIAVTLSWTPRRGVLLAARTAVIVGLVTLVGVVLVLAADLVAWALFPTLELSATGVAASLGTVAGVLVSSSLLAVGLGFALRSTAGALACALLLLLVLPLTLPVFGVGWLDTAAAHLPGSATFSLLGEEISDLTTTAAVVVLVAWPVAAMAAGAAALLRRDAD